VRRSGLPSTISFGHKFRGQRSHRFQSPAREAQASECFQERDYETNGRPEQASRSRNGPVRAGPNAQTPAQAALDRQRKRSRENSRRPRRQKAPEGAVQATAGKSFVSL